MIRRLLLLWAISTGAVMLLPVLFDGVEVDEWPSAALASVVIGLVNVSIGPVLKLVTLPLRWLTLGLFTLLINGFLLWLAAAAVDGFDVTGKGTAVLAAVVYSVVTWIGGLVLLPGDD